MLASLSWLLLIALQGEPPLIIVMPDRAACAALASRAQAGAICLKAPAPMPTRVL